VSLLGTLGHVGGRPNLLGKKNMTGPHTSQNRGWELGADQGDARISVGGIMGGR